MKSELGEELNNLSHKVIGAALEVHRALGPGYLESIYQNAMAVEFRERQISFELEKAIPVTYKTETVGNHRLDILVEGSLVLELKATENVLPVHKSQVLSYLKATKCQLGLLINFNSSVLRDGIERIILSQ